MDMEQLYSSSELETELAGIVVSSRELIALRGLCSDIRLENRVKSRAIADGSAKSSRRGRGMEFAEVRHYQPGDDIRNIDWRVTARTQETYTKLYQEEKERPVYILVDQRTDMFFGSKVQFKSVLAAKLAAAIAWAAFKNRDKLGAILFNESKQSDFRPRQGKSTLFKFFRKLAEFNQDLLSFHQSSLEHEGVRNSLDSMLHELLQVARPGSLIFIISDFHDFNAEASKVLTLLARHNDIELLQTSDPLEASIPKQSQLPISQGNKTLLLNSASNSFQKLYGARWQEEQTILKSNAIKSGVVLNRIDTTIDLHSQLSTVFHRKTGRRS